MGKEWRAGTDGRDWCLMNRPSVKTNVWLFVHDSVGQPCIWVSGHETATGQLMDVFTLWESCSRESFRPTRCTKRIAWAETPGYDLGTPCLPTGPGAGTPTELDCKNAVLILFLRPPRNEAAISLLSSTTPIDTFSFVGRLSLCDTDRPTR